MRFATIATFFVGAVMVHASVEGVEQSTVYETEVQTITSCGPEVPDCPASTAVVQAIESEAEVIAPVETTLASSLVFQNASSVSTEEACAGGISIKTISTSVTTVIPTVIYETIDIPCNTAIITSSVVPTGGYAAPSEGPSTTAPPFTAGASSMGVSMIAAAAGLVALLA